MLSLFRKQGIENVTECKPEQYDVVTLNNRPERLITHKTGEVYLVKKTREILPKPFNKMVYVNPKGFKLGLATEESIHDKAKQLEMKNEIQKFSQHSEYRKNVLTR